MRPSERHWSSRKRGAERAIRVMSLLIRDHTGRLKAVWARARLGHREFEQRRVVRRGLCNVRLAAAPTSPASFVFCAKPTKCVSLARQDPRVTSELGAVIVCSTATGNAIPQRFSLVVSWRGTIAVVKTSFPPRSIVTSVTCVEKYSSHFRVSLRLKARPASRLGARVLDSQCPRCA